MNSAVSVLWYKWTITFLKFSVGTQETQVYCLNVRTYSLPTTSSPLFGQGFWLFSCFLQWALHSFHLGDLFDLDNLSDLLCLIHLVFFFLSFPPSGSVLHELVTCVYLVMNSSSLDTTLKSDISRGFTVRFQDFFNIFCGFLRLPLALYMRCDLLCEWRQVSCDGAGLPVCRASVADTHRWMW